MTNDHNPAALNIGEIKSALTRRSFLRNVAVTGIAAEAGVGGDDRGGVHAHGAHSTSGHARRPSRARLPAGRRGDSNGP